LSKQYVIGSEYFTGDEWNSQKIAELKDVLRRGDTISFENASCLGVDRLKQFLVLIGETGSSASQGTGKIIHINITGIAHEQPNLMTRTVGRAWDNVLSFLTAGSRDPFAHRTEETIDVFIPDSNPSAQPPP